MTLHDDIKAEIVASISRAQNPEATTRNLKIVIASHIAEEFQRISLKVNWPTSLIERKAAVKEIMEHMDLV